MIAPARAQSLVVDHCRLYDAYLDEQMAVWGEWLESTDFSTLSDADYLTFLGYEYGYTAYMAEYGSHDEALMWLSRFNKHIAGVTSDDGSFRAAVIAYSAAAESFAIKIGKGSRIAHAFKCLNQAKEALQTDTTSTAALMVNANVMFYAPKIAGGSKLRAAQLFKQAQQQYRQRGDTVCNWQYREAMTGELKCLKYIEKKKGKSE